MWIPSLLSRQRWCQVSWVHTRNTSYPKLFPIIKLHCNSGYFYNRTNRYLWKQKFLLQDYVLGMKYKTLLPHPVVRCSHRRSMHGKYKCRQIHCTNRSEKRGCACGFSHKAELVKLITEPKAAQAKDWASSWRL